MFLRSIFLFYWLEETLAAIARFSVDNTGISGSVTINDRIVTVDLDLTHVNYSKFQSAASCFTNGMKYHIHEKWEYNDFIDRIGSGPCALIYAGNHMDPWAACSSDTANIYCLSNTHANDTCVKSSSAFTTSGNYCCNTTTYQLNPFVCEVGDLSGKYGVLSLENNKVYRSDSSFWEVDSYDVSGKSIVFHCTTSGSPRAFCAAFDDSDDVSENVIEQSSESAIAFLDVLSEDSYVFFDKNGTYEMDLDFSNISLTCSNLSYYIYDSWHTYSNVSNYSYLGSACSDYVGAVYDPTASCLLDSDSSFCNDGHLCSHQSYEYFCNSTSERYKCSPSDLSGKYGYLNIDEYDNQIISITGYDELMMPLNLIEQSKSIVFQCADSYDMIACAEFLNYASIQTTTSAPSKHHKNHHKKHSKKHHKKHGKKHHHHNSHSWWGSSSSSSSSSSAASWWR